MTYIDDRTAFDADSHLMESPEWLGDYASAGLRERLLPFPVSIAGGDEGPIRQGQDRVDDPDATAKARENVIGGLKGWSALGGMDRRERSSALDLLGIDRQLVFTTFSIVQFAFAKDLDLVYEGAEAHNRAIVDWCSADERLRPVGYLPLEDPVRTLQTLDAALTMGCRALWVAYTAPRGRAPSHIDHEPVWARLAEARVPFVLHVGGGRGVLPPAFHNTGRLIPPDHVGGGENVRARDWTAASHPAEKFLACLVLDGVFDRHPDLRCGCIELGATWLPGFVRRLDETLRTFARNEPQLKELSLLPSEYLARQLRVTPMAFEQVGWIAAQVDPGMLMFSTDYPHPEGGRDPFGKFEASLESVELDDGFRDRFYTGNFADLMGEPVSTQESHA